MLLVQVNFEERRSNIN